MGTLMLLHLCCVFFILSVIFLALLWADDHIDPFFHILNFLCLAQGASEGHFLLLLKHKKNYIIFMVIL